MVIGLLGNSPQLQLLLLVSCLLSLCHVLNLVDTFFIVFLLFSILLNASKSKR